MNRIVKNLSNVEELELKFKDFGVNMKYINLILSGVPVDSEWAVKQLGERVGYDSLLSWIQPPGRTLSDLKCLKRLVLTLDTPQLGLGFNYPIDEIGIYLTFLRLSPELQLHLRGNFSISDALAAKLTGHFKNIVFSPNEPKNKVQARK